MVLNGNNYHGKPFKKRDLNNPLNNPLIHEPFKKHIWRERKTTAKMN